MWFRVSCSSEDGKCSVTMGFHGQASSGPQTRFNDEFSSKSLPSWMDIIWYHHQWILWYIMMLCDICICFFLDHVWSIWLFCDPRYTAFGRSPGMPFWWLLFWGKLRESSKGSRDWCNCRLVRRLWWADSSRGRMTRMTTRAVIIFDHLPMAFWNKFLAAHSISNSQYSQATGWLAGWDGAKAKSQIAATSRHLGPRFLFYCAFLAWSTDELFEAVPCPWN